MVKLLDLYPFLHDEHLADVKVSNSFLFSRADWKKLIKLKSVKVNDKIADENFSFPDEADNGIIYSIKIGSRKGPGGIYITFVEGPSQAITLTSSGIKQEGCEFSYWLDSEEEAWQEYKKHFRRYKKTKEEELGKVFLLVLRKLPELVVKEVHRFNSGNGVLTQKFFNIYSRLYYAKDVY